MVEIPGGSRCYTSSTIRSVTNVLFEINGGKKVATADRVHGKRTWRTTIPLTENDLVFVTNGSCTEGTIYGDQHHAPVGDAEVSTQRLLEPVEEHREAG